MRHNHWLSQGSVVPAFALLRSPWCDRRITIVAMADAGGPASMELQQALQGALLPGEHVVWTGHPDHRRIFSAHDFFLVPFSLMWGGFAIFWELTAWNLGGSMAGEDAPTLLFRLWGIPFVIVGLYLIFGRFIVKRIVRRRTIYAVTDQRVIVLRRVAGTRIDTGPIHALPAVSATIKPSGYGSIDFRAVPGTFTQRRSGRDPWVTGLRGLVFADVPDAQQALAAIEGVRSKPPPS
jgi:hypothetical protein